MQTSSLLLILLLITTVVGIHLIPNSMGQGMMNNQSMMDQMGKGMMKQGLNLNGTIDIESTFSEALKSKINVDIIHALKKAMIGIGSDSMIISAQLDSKQGFLVYNILFLDSNDDLHKVIIDPGNGEILVTKNIGKMMMGPQQGMMMGPQQGMMMGPQQGMMN